MLMPGVPAFPIGYAPIRPDAGTAFTFAAKLAVFLLAIWPAAVSSASSATIGQNRSAPGQVIAGETRIVGMESESKAGSSSDPAEIRRSSNPLPSGDSAGDGDPPRRNGSTGEKVRDLIRATRDPIWKKRWDAVNALGTHLRYQ